MGRPQPFGAGRPFIFHETEGGLQLFGLGDADFSFGEPDSDESDLGLSEADFSFEFSDISTSSTQQSATKATFF